LIVKHATRRMCLTRGHLNHHFLPAHEATLLIMSLVAITCSDGSIITSSTVWLARMPRSASSLSTKTFSCSSRLSRWEVVCLFILVVMVASRGANE
jgi:hypothetical protein